MNFFRNVFCACILILPLAVSAKVVLVNRFEVDPTQEKAFFENWKEAQIFLQTCKGNVRGTLYKSIEKNNVWLNYAIWDSEADFKEAVNNPEFKKIAIKIRKTGSKGSPELFEIVENY